ncbi:T7SS effector LXG polymorphic toxin [Sporosarcina psychrophila]|uniref:T7SS effector LXG polymorphic toxin n=1 Tax=Sporosarcina psychrophila TaxID=1476 RepID=UPI0009ED13D6|nr:T7SS effector LXG polymorphic toxin [Sporosarcina psychrophila]
MKVVDVSPFHDGLRRNNTMLNRLENEMNAIETAVEGLVAMEDSLKGQGGDAIRAFYAECHQPFLQFFMTFKSIYVNVLTQMDSALDALEPDANGFIRETFLEGEVEAGLTEISQLTSSLTDEANDIMNQVADIVALPHLNDSDVQEGVRDARRKRDHTIADLYEFDANQTRALITIENDLKTMETWLSDIEGLFTDGVTAIDFPMDKWAALSSKNTLQTDLAQRTAGMDGVNGGQGSGDEPGNLVGANTSEDEQMKALYAAMEKEQHVGNPVNDYAIDPNTGEYIMMNQGLVRVSKDYGPKELSLIDKAGLGVANFLILDDLKTITDPDSSYMAKGLSMASITPFGPAIKAGNAGIRLVRKSSIVKWISPKKVENVTGKGKGTGKGASSNNGETIDTIDADKDVNIDNFDFGKFLKKHKDDPPEEMKNHHAHHILFKRGNGKAQQELVKEGQEILREYDIDPIYGLENLTWAPNIKGQHDITALRNVVDKIKEVENSGGDRDDIVQILERLGRIAAQRR